VELFEQAGAHAKVSSIHVNGWFGDYNKLSQSLEFLKREFGVSPDDAKARCAFIGDSPNDEPMWQYFPHGFAVANINNFLDDVAHKPAYVADLRGGRGFAQIAARILYLTTRDERSGPGENTAYGWLSRVGA
jgi:hydroxymethylpyrimidine pyrophosphatase-like HAD family hydrolase